MVRQRSQIPAKFVAAATTPDAFPPPLLPELAVAGRSNVGKSSLINTLVGQEGLARTSRTPGRTRQINWFEVRATPRFGLVDLPGFGYAAVSASMRNSWRPLIEAYLSGRTTLAGVLLLIDIRRGPQEEEAELIRWFGLHRTPVVVALTKADKLSRSRRLDEIAHTRSVLALAHDPFAVSTEANEGIDALWQVLLGMVITKRIETPTGP